MDKISNKFIGNTNHNMDKRLSAKREADGSNLDKINTEGLTYVGTINRRPHLTTRAQINSVGC